MEILLKTCKKCGGKMFYDSLTGSLICDHCHDKESISMSKVDIEMHDFDENFALEKMQTPSIVFKCEHCGSRIVSPGLGGNIKCFSCGNHLSKKSEEKIVKPDGIIPFKVRQNYAEYILKKWLRKQVFAPSLLKKIAKTEKLIGFYLPIWRFNFDAQTLYEAEISKNKKESETVKKVTEKKHFEKTLSASTKYLNLMKFGDYLTLDENNFIEEYFVDYSMLEGNVDAKDAFGLIKKDVSWEQDNVVRGEFLKNQPCAKDFSSATKFSNVKTNYLYYPMWVGSYCYKDKIYRCLINGVDGKVQGNFPKSLFKILFLIFGFAIAIFLVVFFLFLK